MGIYAALFQSEVISFLDGLVLIRQAFNEIKKVIRTQHYGMCIIIGLNLDDLEAMINKEKLNLKPAIQNSVCSFSISGTAEDILKITEIAQKEGALSTRVLNEQYVTSSR